MSSVTVPAPVYIAEVSGGTLKATPTTTANPSTSASTDGQTSTTNATGDDANETFPSHKKARNYKYWSDDEILSMLRWFKLPENKGKLARNKAQACRQVARELFENVGEEEYVAVSIRSKLLALEKNFKEGETLQARLIAEGKLSNSEIQASVKLANRFQEECRELFGTSKCCDHESSENTTSTQAPGASLSTTATSSTTTQPSTSNGGANHPHPTPVVITAPPSSPSGSYQPSSSGTPSSGTTARHILPRLPDTRSVEPVATGYEHQLSYVPQHYPVPPMTQYPHHVWIQEPVNAYAAHARPSNHQPDQHPALSSTAATPAPLAPATASTPAPASATATTSVPTTFTQNNQDIATHLSEKKRKQRSQIELDSKRRLQEAKYAARQAEYEAIKAEHECQRMESLLSLSKVEKERDELAIQRLKLEIELAKLKK